MANQPTPAPTHKVRAGGLAGATTVILVWLLEYAGVSVPAEVASAITVLLSFGASYVTPEP